MSRYSEYDDYDENFPNEGQLWLANAARALKGKRGRKVLADLREALLALPEKRLIASALCTVNPDKRAEEIDPANDDYQRLLFREVVTEQGEGVCAIGAYLWHRKVKAGADPAEAFDSLPLIYDDEDSDGLERTARAAKQDADMVFSLAWTLAYKNDETFRDKTPEGRHVAFLAWIDTELAPSSAGLESTP